MSVRTFKKRPIGKLGKIVDGKGKPPIAYQSVKRRATSDPSLGEPTDYCAMLSPETQVRLEGRK